MRSGLTLKWSRLKVYFLVSVSSGNAADTPGIAPGIACGDRDPALDTSFIANPGGVSKLKVKRIPWLFPLPVKASPNTHSDYVKLFKKPG